MKKNPSEKETTKKVVTKKSTPQKSTTKKSPSVAIVSKKQTPKTWESVVKKSKKIVTPPTVKDTNKTSQSSEKKSQSPIKKSKNTVKKEIIKTSVTPTYKNDTNTIRVLGLVQLSWIILWIPLVIMSIVLNPLFGWFIATTIYYFLRKEAISHEERSDIFSALNFHLSFAAYFMLLIIFFEITGSLIGSGILNILATIFYTFLMMLVLIFWFICVSIGIVKMISGRRHTYPLSIRFFK